MTLFATEFDRSFKHRVVHSDDCVATVNANVAGGPCVLMSVTIDNIEGSAINWVRCANGTSSSVGADEIRVNVPCPKQTKRTFTFPEGIPFKDGLSFWCSGSSTIDASTVPNTTVNTGKIKVTLVLG